MKKSTVLVLGLLFSVGIIACSHPTYQRQIVTKYDNNGNKIGTEVTESISQPSPWSSPMKVKITQPEELED